MARITASSPARHHTTEFMKPYLVVCVRSSLAASCDGGEDLVGGLGPREGLGIGVGLGDVGADRALKVLGAGEHAAFEPAAGEYGEPALDQIEPGGRGRGKVQVKAGTLHEPVVHQLGLVDRGVVEHEVDGELRRDG